MRAVLISIAAIAIAPSAVAADPLVCPAPTHLPPARTGGGLTVTSPPRPMRPPGGTRLRSHVTGSMGTPHVPSDRRFWAGPEVPVFVPIAIGTKELFLLDPVGDRYMALYRDPYDQSSCRFSADPKVKELNCDFEVRIFDCDGATIATLPLNKYMSKPAQLEVQDVRLADNILYFNEACESYSAEQGGTCSALIAVDVRDGRLLWRTKNLVSNDVFLVVGGYVLTGYGFTKEPASLFLVRRSDGIVVAKQPIKQLVYPGGSHDALTLERDNIVRVGIYEHPEDLLVQLVGIEGPKPSFKLIQEPKPIEDRRFRPDGTPNPDYKMPPAPIRKLRPGG